MSAYTKQKHWSWTDTHTSTQWQGQQHTHVRTHVKQVVVVDAGYEHTHEGVSDGATVQGGTMFERCPLTIRRIIQTVYLFGPQYEMWSNQLSKPALLSQRNCLVQVGQMRCLLWIPFVCGSSVLGLGFRWVTFGHEWGSGRLKFGVAFSNPVTCSSYNTRRLSFSTRLPKWSPLAIRPCRCAWERREG